MALNGLAAMPCPVSFVEYSGHWSAATKFGLTCHSENATICEHIGRTIQSNSSPDLARLVIEANAFLPKCTTRSTKRVRETPPKRLLVLAIREQLELSIIGATEKRRFSFKVWIQSLPCIYFSG